MSGLYPSVAQLVERLTVVCRYCVSVYSEINWSPVRFWSFGSFLALSLSFVASRRLLLSRISHATRWLRHSATCQQQQQQQPLVRRRLHRSSIGNDRSHVRLLAVVCLPLVLFVSSIPSRLVSSCLVLSRFVAVSATVADSALVCWQQKHGSSRLVVR